MGEARYLSIPTASAEAISQAKTARDSSECFCDCYESVKSILARLPKNSDAAKKRIDAISQNCARSVRNTFASSRQKNGCVRLIGGSDILDARQKATETSADTLRAVADALGELVSNDVYAAIDIANAPNDPFLRSAMPRLINQFGFAITYRTLREAWRHRARVRFRYPQSKRPSALEERVVEPHLVTYYDGRYYLVAYDAQPKTSAWRQFALDRIAGPIAPAGTFVRRTIPHQYRGEDALGLFKSVAPLEVAIAISPQIAASVLARVGNACSARDRRTRVGR